jgi:hypothetical protein
MVGLDANSDERFKKRDESEFDVAKVTLGLAFVGVDEENAKGVRLFDDHLEVHAEGDFDLRSRRLDLGHGAAQ